ncbi:Free methionine-R-sulfoxide reductase [Fusarium sp. NRRL 52700]|nr:Free methionine-R-sulfoxide reductase [Fusarium sp. NRRL 52700]
MMIQVHADASNFADDITKKDAYEQVLWQAEGLITDQRNWVRQTISVAQLLDLPSNSYFLTGLLDSNLSNAASLLWHAYKSLESPSKDVNWTGFYVLDKSSQDPQLILGPFQGKVACQTIKFGKGVCGVAAATQETQLVRDVEEFPGHIACDGDSKSEIVVPIAVTQDDGSKKLVAIIDIDCAELNGFDEVDKAHLEQLAALLAKSCDW